MIRQPSAFEPRETVEPAADERERGAMAAGAYRRQRQRRQGRIAATFHQVMEVFHPIYAVRVWAARAEAGLSMPVRLHVYHAEDGRLYFDCQQPSELLAPYGLPALDAIGAELDPKFERTCKSIEG